MHAVAHRLPHRGPGATRARARWQPYSSAALSTSLNTPSRTSSPLPYLPTPASSVCSSPPAVQIHAVCDPEPPKVHQSNYAPRVGTLRDAQKSRYVTGLVDQAIRSLCDTWRSEIIPSAFSHPSLSSSLDEPPLTPRDHDVGHEHSQNPLHNSQLLSPVSPSTQTTAFPSLDTNSCDAASGDKAAPIKGFVHEVLRRSRTSVGVLQTALCYLEAVRTRIPEVLRKDEEQRQSGQFHTDEASDLDRIIVETSAETSIRLDDASQVSQVMAEVAETVRMSDHTDPTATQDYGAPAVDGVALPPLPPQPSPLLCPRRTFLACLILASKFMQDRSYSNRAWAKLAGLPPREIGRCERAVGNALEWRLWVGKDLNVGTSGGKRSLLRSRSDGDVLNSATAYVSNPGPYLTPPTTPHSFRDGTDLTPSVERGVCGPSQAENTRVRALRRCATVPSVVAEPPVPRSYTGGPVFSAAFAEEPVRYDSFDPRFSTSVNRQAGAYECGVPSPQWSTPPLTYSPMSTSSTSSDGSDDRTVQMVPLADFPETSSNAGFSAGCTDVWRDRSDVEPFGATYPKPSMFNTPGPQTTTVYPAGILDAGGPYLAPMETGPVHLPSISVGFPFCG